MNTGLLTILIVIGVLILLVKVLPTSMYITAQFSGTPIPFLDLVFMRLRKIDVAKVVESYIMLQKSNIDIRLVDLETMYLLNHNLQNITRGLITAKQSNIPLTLEQAKEADKKGINLMEEIERTIESKT